MPSNIKNNLAKVLLVSFGALATSYVSAGGGATDTGMQQSARKKALRRSDLPATATDLKFREFFRMPIGPGGLEASAKLIALDGRRVRILGYMARQEKPSGAFFILAPLPVSLGDEDESLSDDLPASVLFVHVDSASAVLAYRPGLLQLTGTLSLGPMEESDGRVSTVRLLLDPEPAQDLALVREDGAGALEKFP
jgi:hypothetical protein